MSRTLGERRREFPGGEISGVHIPPGGKDCRVLILGIGWHWVALGDLEPKQFQGQAGGWLSIVEAGRGD